MQNSRLDAWKMLCMYLTGCFFMVVSTEGAGLPPANDNCSNAIYISDVVDLPFTTVEATFDGDGVCMSSPNIWYCYIADSTGPALFSLCGSEYDTMLAVYDGNWCYDSETIMDCNDDAMCDGEATLQSRVVIDVVEGHEYLIEVGGWDEETGAGVLTVQTPWYPTGACCLYGDCVATNTKAECKAMGGNWFPYETCPLFNCPVPPSNDDCQNGIPVVDGHYYFSNIGASTDGPPEYGDCSSLQNDVWLIYEAQETGQVMVSLRSTRFDTVMAVYEGDCPTEPGFLIACNNDTCGPQSELIFNADAGMSYPIRIGGVGADRGEGWILIYKIRELAGCPEDLTGDGRVNIDDLFQILGRWGQCDACPEDLNSDGKVNIDDLFVILATWGDCPPLGFDDCDSPASVQDGVYWFDTSDAATATSPPWDCGWDVGHDIWVCYQAPVTGVTEFSLTFSGFDTVLQVYEGCTDPMWLIGCNDDYCGKASGVTIDVTEGSLYKVRIGGYGQDAGFGRLSIQGFVYSYPFHHPGPYDPPFVYGLTGPYFCGAHLFGEQSRFIVGGSMIAVVSLVGIQLLASKRRLPDPAAAR